MSITVDQDAAAVTPVSIVYRRQHAGAGFDRALPAGVDIVDVKMHLAGAAAEAERRKHALSRCFAVYRYNAVADLAGGVQRRLIVGGAQPGQDFGTESGLVERQRGIDIDHGQAGGCGTVSARDGGNFFAHSMLHIVK